MKPTKRFWKETKAELVGKIDNDILVPKGWVQKLTDVHQRVPNLGVAGYCHFRKEDFDDDETLFAIWYSAILYLGTFFFVQNK